MGKKKTKTSCGLFLDTDESIACFQSVQRTHESDL